MSIGALPISARIQSGRIVGPENAVVYLLRCRGDAAWIGRARFRRPDLFRRHCQITPTWHPDQTHRNRRFQLYRVRTDQTLTRTGSARRLQRIFPRRYPGRVVQGRRSRRHRIQQVQPDYRTGRLRIPRQSDPKYHPDPARSNKSFRLRSSHRNLQPHPPRHLFHRC